MSEAVEELTGEEMLKQNMAAFEAGEDTPHEEGLNITEEPKEEEIPVDTIQNDESEEEPRKSRHMSREEWEAAGKDPDLYKSEEEFKRVDEIRDGELTRQKLAEQLASHEALMKEMIENQGKIAREAAERGKQEALKELERQKQEAIDNNDTEAAIKLERDIVNKEIEPIEVEKPKPAEAQLPPDIQVWLNDNKWYGKHQGATQDLDYLLQMQADNGVDFKDAIGPAMQKIKRSHSILFDDEPAPQKRPPPKITEQSRKPASNSKKTYRFSDIEDAGARQVAKTTAKKLGMNENDYVKSFLGVE